MKKITVFMKGKKIHKVGASNVFRALCKVQNKTYCFNYSTVWSVVDCENCLKKRKGKERG